MNNDIISIKWFLMYNQFDCVGIQCKDCIYRYKDYRSSHNLDECHIIQIENRRYRDGIIRS